MFAISFIIAAISNVVYYPKKIQVITNRGLLYPAFVFWFGFAMQIIGSLAILLDIYLFYGALILILFTLLASLIFHDFWNEQGDSYRLKMQGLVSNISVLAGLILLAYALGKFTY